MSETACYKYEITGIDCADCAAMLEEKIKGIEGIREVSLSFMRNSLSYECDHDFGKKIEEEMRAIVQKEEPDAKIVAKGHTHKHAHEHVQEERHDHAACACGHDHEHTEHEHASCGCMHDHEEDEHPEEAVYRFEITGIDCADCAAMLEEKIKGIEDIREVSLSFMRNSLSYECDHDLGKKIEEEMRAIVQREEPDAKIVAKGHTHKHAHEHEQEENHDHGHPHEEEGSSEKAGKYRLRIENIDCADCAASLERSIAKLDGISNVRLSFINSSLTFDCDDPKAMEEKIRALAEKEEPEVRVCGADEKEPAENSEEAGREQIMKVRLCIGALLFVIGLFLDGTPQILCELAAYIFLGYDVVLKAIAGIGRGQIFDENFLMSTATIAAMYLSDFKEAAGVMLFYQIGEFFQDMAVKNSRRSIGDLMNIRPDTAWVKRGDDFVSVSPEEVHAGDIIRIRPGERVPLDGVVTSGSSSLNTASLTGESKLRDVDAGDEVISGSVNESGLLEVRVSREYGESTVARILDLVENQDSRKAKAENFITKFSRIYTPVVVALAIAVAVITGLVTGNINEGIYRACTFLVISCPCALVISVPLSFFAGIGGLSSRGILVKGSNLIEPLANIRQVVFDKTGTLTSGKFAVSEILDCEDREHMLYCAACAEAFSNHPIADGIRTAYGKEISREELGDVKEIAGRGVSVSVGGKNVLAGNIRLMEDNGISVKVPDRPGSLVFVAEDGKYLGCAVLEDQLKEGAEEAIRTLQKENVKCIMVSGDVRRIAERAADALGMDAVYAECLPEDKVRHVNELLSAGITAFVGDGVNDAPVIAAADLGFAMGALGSDAAIEAADIVIMDDKPSGVCLAVKAARRILTVVRQNIVGAIAVKIITLILGAFGIANMWWAIFADTGVAMLCVLNAMRLLRIAKNEI